MAVSPPRTRSSPIRCRSSVMCTAFTGVVAVCSGSSVKLGGRTAKGRALTSAEAVLSARLVVAVTT